MINKKFCAISLAFLLCACGEKSNSQSGNDNKEQKEAKHKPDRHVDLATQQGDSDPNKNGKNKPNVDNGKGKNGKNTSNKENKGISKKQDKNFPTGLKNLTASCYLNSSVQQLYNIEAIRNAVLNGKFDNDKKLKALQEMFKGMSSDSTYFDPNQLPYELGYKGNQEDAHEFLLPLLDVLVEKIAGIKDLITFSSKTVYSKTCGHDPISGSVSNNIFLLGINKDKLEDCLDEYFSSESMVEDNQIFCDDCNQNVDGEKKEQLISAPQTFIVALNRFDYQCNKINKKVEFPLNFQIQKEWCAENLSSNNLSYNLTGVIVHSGDCSGGHYWSYVKKGEKWYKCDDKTVSEVNMNDTLLKSLYGDKKNGTSAYILFYSKAE